MGDKRWKAHERNVARRLGGHRLPNNGYGQPDVIAGDLALEVKCRTLPDWLKQALAQAERNAPQGKIPVVVLVDSQRGVKARRVAVMQLELLQNLLLEKMEQ
jgi:hypothetical protein